MSNFLNQVYHYAAHFHGKSYGSIENSLYSYIFDHYTELAERPQLYEFLSNEYNAVRYSDSEAIFDGNELLDHYNYNTNGSNYNNHPYGDDIVGHVDYA